MVEINLDKTDKYTQLEENRNTKNEEQRKGKSSKMVASTRG